MKYLYRLIARWKGEVYEDQLRLDLDLSPRPMNSFHLWIIILCATADLALILWVIHG